MIKTRLPVIVWTKPPKRTRTQLIHALRTRLKGRAVDEAHLFGSHSRNEADSWSDIDLILVADSSLPFPERFHDYEDLWDEFGAVDLFLYTPGEWKKMKTGDSSLLRTARKH